MAGRGRGATLPAWLTAAENNGNDFTPVITAPSSFISNNNNISQQQHHHHMNHLPMPIDNKIIKSNINNNNPEFIGQYEEYMQSNHNINTNDHYNSTNNIISSGVGSMMNSNSMPMASNNNILNHINSRDNNMNDSVRDGNRRVGGQKRSSSRSLERKNRERDRRDRSRSKDARDGQPWVPRDKSIRNFDVRPPEGIELPQIGVITPINGVPNSYFSYANNPAVTGIALPYTMTKGGSGSGGIIGSNAGGGYTTQPPKNLDTNNSTSMLTRHARRIYAGGIPPRSTEQEILVFFNEVVTRALLPVRLNDPPVVKVYINAEKVYAFVEFQTIELTTACMQLDGIKFEHYTGAHILRIRRPMDYRPELITMAIGPIPVLNLEAVGVIGGTSVTNGPGKIFIGGLSYNLTDDQVMELLAVFGPIKGFHQVRDPSTGTSKGYGFCEYISPSSAEAAIAGLHNMPFGEKLLSVRASTTAPPVNSNIQQQQQQPPLPLGNPLSMGITGFPSNNNYNMNNMMMITNQQPPLPSMIPTRVLRLSNMVTRDDLYNENEYHDIKEDVRLECIQQGGPVESLIIPRTIDGYPIAAEGYIFVEFSNVISSQKAYLALNGRKFADKVVVVQYFDERKFASQDLI